MNTFQLQKSLEIVTFITFLAFAIYPLIIFAENSNPSLLINEIGIKETSEYEWIELYNKSEAAIDITGWKFYEDGTNHGITVYRGKPVIEPGEYTVIANKADMLAQKYPDYAGTILDSSWGTLKEEGEEIGLKDSAGNTVELFTYPSLMTDAVSLERIDQNTVASEPTNWAPHPLLHSLGKPNENGLVITTPAETAPPENQILSEPEIQTQIETVAANEPESVELTPLSTDTVEEVLPGTPLPPSTSSVQAPPPPPPPPLLPLSPPIINIPPKAIIQIQSGSLIAVSNTTVNFDGRSSFDPNGDKLTFLWDMGDGVIEKTANPAPHKYSKPGTYKVTLTVSDTQGAEDKAYEYVHVVNQESAEAPKPAKPIKETPPLSFKAPQPVFLPQTIQIAPDINRHNLSQIRFKVTGWITLEPEEYKSAKKTAKKTSVKDSKKKLKKTSVKKKKTAPKPKRTPSKKTAKKTAKVTFQNGDLSESIRLTEIMPNPEKGEEEWIEIWNSGDEPVGLGNWSFSRPSKSKPYLIPSSITLQPNEYLVFPKSETRIALKNAGDSITLKDFTDTIIDTVSYENAQKGRSYALADGTETWEWVEATPGDENPAFQKLSGTVAKLITEAEQSSFSLLLADGVSKEIQFAHDVLDPAMAEALLKQGAMVILQTTVEPDGTYKLRKIEEVKNPPPEENAKSPLRWGIIGLIAVGTIMNTPLLIKTLRKLT